MDKDIDFDTALGCLMMPHFNSADIKIVCVREIDATIFQMECQPNVLTTLEILHQFAEMPKPNTFIKLGDGVVENAAFIEIQPSGVKKVLLELDIATGKATLKAK